jgi:hypothetical protein
MFLLQNLRKQRQARALGAAMQVSYGLSSDERITRDELTSILTSNLKASRIEGDDTSRQSTVCLVQRYKHHSLSNHSL